MWRPIHEALARTLSGERAVTQACEQNRIERWFTFPNFERSAERCADELRRAGLDDVEVESFPADGETMWSGWGRMMAWDVESARLWMIEPRAELLADWSLKPQSLVMYSGACEVEGEVVEWNGELDADLTGKIPFTRHRINDVYPQMRQLGAGGIVSDFIGTLPGVRDRFDLPDDVRWENSAIRMGHGDQWGFMLTPRQGRMLRDLLREGPVRLRAEVRSRNYPGIFKSATGVIRGDETEEQEILFVTHLYEPGANDNASGTGCGLEMARALNESIESGALPRPRRSIRFLFNWEGFGLYAWCHKHRDRMNRILGGLNIDEIGVDQAKGRSVVHLFMPPAANPSCVGDLIAHLCAEILSPQIRWRDVADRAEIINDTITSDPNMDIVLPCLIQYPSYNYHASSDTPDTLSPETMKAIGLVSGTHLYFLAGAGPSEGAYIARLAEAGRRRKLEETELALLEGAWPFDAERTQEWFSEQCALKAASLGKFGLPAAEVQTLQRELTEATAAWCEKWRDRFPEKQPRRASAQALDRAAGLVLRRTTLGSPKAWGSLQLTAEEDAEYRRVLYGNNLDLLFHRICYWVDGERSMLDIVERLEFELYELNRDTAIARTSSGSLIAGGESMELDIEAVLYIVDLIVRSGYLEAR